MGRWGGYKQWLMGNDEYSIRVNKILMDLKEALQIKYLSIKTNEKREPLASELVQAYFESIGRPQVSLMALITDYITAKGLSIATQDIYTQRIKRILSSFIEHSFDGQTDISVEQIDLTFLYKFELYLTTTYRKPNGAALGRLTRNEYVSKLKALMRYGHDIGHLKSYPFASYRPQATKFDTVKSAAHYSRLVSPGELHKIDSVSVADPSLHRVRFLFLFQSWTGMAYADMVANGKISLTIRKDLCGNDIVLYNQVKIGELAFIPLFPELQEIIAALEDNVTPPEYGNYLMDIKRLFIAYEMGISRGKATGAL